MNFKHSIKRVTIIVAIMFYMALCSSCSELMPGDGTFLVESLKEGDKTTNYRLVSVINFGTVHITDERGKYHVGDTLYISGKRCQ